MNIILWGHPGSGKTYFGETLARHLELDWIDLDQEIEAKCGMKPSQYVEAFGRLAFRSLETRTLGSLPECPILSVGGSTLLYQCNRELIDGVVVNLECPKETLRKRHRTSLGDFDELYQSRFDLYSEYSDVSIHPTLENLIEVYDGIE